MTNSELTKAPDAYVKQLSGEYLTESSSVRWYFKKSYEKDNNFGDVVFHLKVKYAKLKKITITLSRYHVNEDVFRLKGLLIPNYLVNIAHEFLRNKTIKSLPTISLILPSRTIRRNNGYLDTIEEALSSSELYNYKGADWLGTILIKGRLPKLSISDAFIMQRFIRDSNISLKDIDLFIFTMLPSSHMGNNERVVDYFKVWNFIYNGEPHETYGDFINRWGSAPMNMAKANLKIKDDEAKILNAPIYNSKDKMISLYELQDKLKDQLYSLTVSDFYNLYFVSTKKDYLKDLNSDEIVKILKAISSYEELNKTIDFHKYSGFGSPTIVLHWALLDYFSLNGAEEILSELLKSNSMNKNSINFDLFRETLIHSSIPSILWKYAYEHLGSEYIIEIMRSNDALKTIDSHDWLALVKQLKEYRISGPQLSWVLYMASN